MPEFDSIDLMNYAIYGNELDPEWADIRNYIKSNASAQKELEELRRSIPHPQNIRKRRDPSQPQELGRDKSYDSDPKNANSPEEKKKWWSIFQVNKIAPLIVTIRGDVHGKGSSNLS